MCNYGYEDDTAVNLRDSVRGIVSGQSPNGLFINIRLEDEEAENGRITVPAFGHWAGRVPVGAEVICTIKKWARAHRIMEVRVDSVCYECDMAAA